MTSITPELCEKVWSMHCLHKTVGYIAAKLGIDEAEVRRVICVYWRNME